MGIRESIKQFKQKREQKRFEKVIQTRKKIGREIALKTARIREGEKLQRSLVKKAAVEKRRRDINISIRGASKLGKVGKAVGGMLKKTGSFVGERIAIAGQNLGPDPFGIRGPPQAPRIIKRKKVRSAPRKPKQRRKKRRVAAPQRFDVLGFSR